MRGWCLNSWMVWLVNLNIIIFISHRFLAADKFPNHWQTFSHIPSVNPAAPAPPPLVDNGGFQERNREWIERGERQFWGRWGMKYGGFMAVCGL